MAWYKRAAGRYALLISGFGGLMDDLLNVEQIADMFRVDRETVRNWFRSGRLPGRHVGRRWFALASDVEGVMRGGDDRASGESAAAAGGSSATSGRSASASSSRVVVPRIIG